MRYRLPEPYLPNYLMIKPTRYPLKAGALKSFGLVMPRSAGLQARVRLCMVEPI